MTLRDQCVEAAAEQIHKLTWPTDVGWDESTETYRQVARGETAAAFDAILDVLEGNAEEWERTVPAFGAGVQVYGLTVQKLVAALRIPNVEEEKMLHPHRHQPHACTVDDRQLHPSTTRPGEPGGKRADAGDRLVWTRTPRTRENAIQDDSR